MEINCVHRYGIWGISGTKLGLSEKPAKRSFKKLKEASFRLCRKVLQSYHFSHGRWPTQEVHPHPCARTQPGAAESEAQSRGGWTRCVADHCWNWWVYSQIFWGHAGLCRLFNQEYPRVTPIISLYQATDCNNIVIFDNICNSAFSSLFWVQAVLEAQMCKDPCALNICAPHLFIYGMNLAISWLNHVIYSI